MAFAAKGQVVRSMPQVTWVSHKQQVGSTCLQDCWGC